MSSAARTVLAFPIHKNPARIASLLSYSVSCIWKRGFDCLVPVADSDALHDEMIEKYEFMNLGGEIYNEK